MVTLGVSACLLGHSVRYDGSHKKNDYITKVLASQVTLKSICPETAIGLPTPREPIRLIQENNQTKVKKVSDHRHDYSQQLLQLSSKNHQQIATWHGLISMQKSPSCGLNSTKLHAPNGTVLKHQEAGLFIQACRQQFPDLPIIEAIELEQQSARWQFFSQVFTGYRWQQQVLKQPGIEALQAFHRRHKFLLQAHSEKHYRQMGPLAATATQLKQNLCSYRRLLTQCLQQKPDRKQHLNAILHLFGFLKNRLTAKEKQHLLQTIEQYQQQRLPLAEPLRQLKQAADQYQVKYLQQQIYFQPYPNELNQH